MRALSSSSSATTDNTSSTSSTSSTTSFPSPLGLVHGLLPRVGGGGSIDGGQGCIDGLGQLLLLLLLSQALVSLLLPQDSAGQRHDSALHPTMVPLHTSTT